MEIFKNIIEIDSAIKFYKSLARITVILSIMAVVCISIYYFNRLSKMQDNIYILTQEGDIMSANRASAMENRHIEAIAHTRLFIMDFFDLDRFTYQQKISQSYDLGTSCIYNLHQKLVNDGWFTNMEQYNIIQSAVIEDITVQNNVSPYIVNAKFKINVNSEASEQIVYGIEINFTISEGKSRTKENPHALMITNIEVINFSETVQ